MAPFLRIFFPEVQWKQAHDTGTNQYCKFNSQKLTMFTSSLYLAALVSSIGAAAMTRSLGRKLSMMIGGILFLIGAVINGFAYNVAMLIVGRIFLGLGIGFANQVCLFTPVGYVLNLILEPYPSSATLVASLYCKPKLIFTRAKCRFPSYG